MKGLSKKETEVIADLEFQKKYYFTREDIKHHFENKKQMINTIFNLSKKERIIGLNKNKYFLIPIRARKGKWTDHPLIIADELCDGENYFVGGWYAAYYWKLTDQVPMQVDIYATRRQGEIKILNKKFIFHRTTKKRIKMAVTEETMDHKFRIMGKENIKKWIKSKY